MPSDLEIARSVPLLPITDIAAKVNLTADDIETYGRYKAKVDASIAADQPNGKLILVTAITPTPAGEGKTTITISLGDAISALGKKCVLALREPSLGPVFGVKGGATGGGRAQVGPMEDINLHFTGDFHAISAANNLLAAMIDNHIFHGNALNIDPRRICWHRCVDMNDRQLRNVIDGLGGHTNGNPREDSYDITVASEVMACLCLADDLADLKARLGRIVIGYTYDRQPVTASDLKAEGAMTVLLKDAMKPNLVQTLEHTPALIHGGPFANIAHGCNSIAATRLALRLGDYTVTEAGFGGDLGCEKFLDIKCRQAGLRPNAVVVVATIRALKLHGGVKKDNLGVENLEALEKGLPNLLRHVDNVRSVYGLPCVVAINRFPTDTEAEIQLLKDKCAQLDVNAVLCESWAKGSQGGLELAKEVLRLCEEENHFDFAYPDDAPLDEKLNLLAKRIYRGKGAVLTAEAKTQMRNLVKLGYGNLPVCVAKTQYSFSDNPKLLGAPEGFTITVRNLRVSAGAGFVVALTGDIMTMPGLPAVPAAESIDINENGEIVGLF